ncbi:MAG: FAD:protein FMN transferase [Eubacteriales bacterium]|nr:FAD:protein FMN transferase [Eubacteriales bacterium]
MKKQIMLLTLLCSVLAAGCTPSAPLEGGRSPGQDTTAVAHRSIEVFAMDTVMSLTAYGDNADAGVAAAKEEIERLEALLAVGSDTGDVKPLNRDRSRTIAPDTKAILTYVLALNESTGGAFDCTIGTLKKAWGFYKDEYRVPTAEEVRALLPQPGQPRLTIEGDTATLADGARLDLGGIGKGFTSARIIELFAAHGIESGIISLGGNVQTLGHKPDGSAWRIGIQDPRDPEALFAIIDTADEAVITSGGYQQCFERDGVRYHHIIDPHTGYPAESGLISATVVSPDGTLADGLSTALYVMGTQRAAEYWHDQGKSFDMILMEDDGNVLITEGLEGRVVLQDGGRAEVLR